MPRAGWGKDSIEVEGYVRGFSRRRPDVDIVTLRLANIIGPGIRTPMTDYFALPVIPAPLGFDARLQFVHEDDSLEALRLATIGEAGGTSTSPATASSRSAQAARLAGRPTLPVPLPAGRLTRQLVRRAGPGRLLATTRCSSSPTVAGSTRRGCARLLGLRAAVHHARRVPRLRPRPAAAKGRCPP